jgi:hypothetical protein
MAAATETATTMKLPVFGKASRNSGEYYHIIR